MLFIDIIKLIISSSCADLQHLYCVHILCHQRADLTSKAVVEVISKTSEFIQPNPTSRAKLAMLTTVSKIRGQVNSPGYPQPEGLLGESMTKYGRELGEDTNFGKISQSVSIIRTWYRVDEMVVRDMFVWKTEREEAWSRI